MKVKEMMEWLKQFDKDDVISMNIEDDGDIYIEGFGCMWVEVEIDGKVLKF